MLCAATPPPPPPSPPRCAKRITYNLYKRSLNDNSVCDLSIILLYEFAEDDSSMMYYPVNELRNLARLQVCGHLDGLVFSLLIVVLNYFKLLGLL